MEKVETIWWYTITIITLILEFLWRICLCPFGIITVLIASTLGNKEWLKDNPFLDYCSPWKLHYIYFPITANVSKWFDPNYKW